MTQPQIPQPVQSAQSDLQIILYPDPRLKKRSEPVTRFDAPLAELAARMLELMRQAKGVGLAAPQVGRNIRLFVTNATGQSADDRVYINPELSDALGDEEGEEGCLSIPKLNIKVSRRTQLRMIARDVAGNPIDEIATGFVARVWQHETDHLDGILLTDRMGPVARLANRKLLRELEERFRKG